MSKQFALEAIGLQTPRGRLSAAAVLHIALFAVPFAWLEAAHLSLYERLGIASPSIGLTRSYWLLLHGNPVAAWERNKLIYVVVPVLFTVLFMDVLKVIGEKKRATVSF